MNKSSRFLKLFRDPFCFGAACAIIASELFTGIPQSLAAKTDEAASNSEVAATPPSADFGRAKSATVTRTAQGANNAAKWMVSAPGGMRIRAFWCTTERNVGYWQPLPGATSIAESAEFIVDPKRTGHTYTLHLTRHQSGLGGAESSDITQPTEMPPAFQLEPRVSVEKAGLVPGECLVLWSARVTSQGTTMKVVSFGICAMKPGDQWPPDDSAPRDFLELADIARGIDPLATDTAGQQDLLVQRLGLSFQLPAGWVDNTFNETTEDPRPHIFLQEGVSGKPRAGGATIRIVRQDSAGNSPAKASGALKTAIQHDAVQTSNVNAMLDVYPKPGDGNLEVLSVHMNVVGPQPYLLQCTYSAADRAKYMAQIKSLLTSLKPVPLDPPARLP